MVKKRKKIKTRKKAKKEIKFVRQPKYRKKISRKRKISRRRKTRRRIKRKVIRKNKMNFGGGKMYYSLNSKFEFLNELKNLILTSPPASFSRMAKRISSLGRIKLALVSGVFLNKENVADLLIVGDDIDRRRFKKFLHTLEAEVGTQLLYAIMDKEEFTYRRAMFDRFVRLMLEGPREVLIDRIGL